MAGDWIKMRGNLWDDPRVAKLCDLCDCGEAQVIGALYWLWATADQHTENGVMPGLTLRQIDRKTGLQGFGEGLCAIGWLEDHPEGVRIVKFEEHNGESAKKRCQTAKRVANHRAGNADVTQPALQIEDKSVSGALAREREEKSTSSLRSEVGARASRLPQDWVLPDEWRDWAKAERGDLDPLKTAEQFADYWRAKPGKDGRKTDWLATWRNWVRNQRAPQPVKTPQAFAPPLTTPSRPGIDPALAKALAEEQRLADPAVRAAAEAARIAAMARLKGLPA